VFIGAIRYSYRLSVESDRVINVSRARSTHVYRESFPLDSSAEQ
jgi:hypothetical protein